MAIERRHAVEVSDADATLVLSETVSKREVTAIRRECRGLPAHVRTLHLDLAGVTQFEGGVLDAVRGAVHEWRQSREGSHRLELVSPLLVARLQEHCPASPTGTGTAYAPLARRLAL